MTKTHCPTCPTGTPNPANFGQACDDCEAARQKRLTRSRSFVRSIGQADTEFGRAIHA